MKILAIETSCDETAAAVTEGRKIISNVIFSQINLHREYGGVYPALAKREHQKKINPVINKALRNARVTIENIDALAVTFGPGLVVSLEVGLEKAKELVKEYKKPLIPVDHIEGHIYSAFCQNKNGLPKRKFNFPFLALIVSGGTTSLVLIEDHLGYQILGQTLDDAIGEALDKAAKMMGLSYPGGPIIEELAKKGNSDFLDLPIPMQRIKTLDFSYSGLKTAFKRELERIGEKTMIKNLPHLAASFQQTAFDSIIQKTTLALTKTKVKTLVAVGGVTANAKLRQMIRKKTKELGVKVYFPAGKKLYNDNAAMIGVAGYFKYQKGVYLDKDFSKLDRVGRPNLKMWLTARRNSSSSQTSCRNNNRS